jgi:type IV pilus assembly protein PilM
MLYGPGQNAVGQETMFEGGAGAASASEIVCLDCDRPNPRERKHCAGCGTPLWDHCPKCQSPHALGEAFCGDCGANLTAAFQARARRIEEDVARAQKLRDEHRYDEAVALLDVVARKEKHFRLKRQLAAAGALRDELASQGVRARAEAEAALQQAQECLASYAFERAIVLLETPPAPLRTKEHEQLLETARHNWREVLALGGRVREGLQAGQTYELLPDLERLIGLKPDHAQAQKIANQLCERAVQAAKKGMAEHKHGAALKLLSRVRRLTNDEQIDEAYQQARELVWLLDDLRQSPYADKTLLAVAERILKLAPGHVQAANLHEKLKQRLSMTLADPRAAAPPWAAAGEKSHLGPPVEWLGCFARVRRGPECDVRTLRASPGRFMTAYGLALQGLEKTPIAINLLPKDKEWIDRLPLGKLASLGRRNQRRSAWGIEIGAAALKAVKLSCDEKSGDVVLEACELLPHKKQFAQANEGNDHIRETLSRFLERRPIGDDRVVVGLPAARLLHRVLRLPATKSKKLADLVEYEASHQLPFRLAELKWDFQLLGNPSGNGGPTGDGQQRVLIVAAKDYAVMSIANIFQELKVRLDVLQSECLALHNAALAEFFGDSSEDASGRSARLWRPGQDSAVALLEVGASGANLAICAPDVVWSRALRVGGADFTSALVQSFQWTFAHAEQVKLSPSEAPQWSQFYDALAPPFHSLIKEVERSLESFKNEHPDTKIERIFGLGGGFLLHGLPRCLRNGPPESAALENASP